MGLVGDQTKDAVPVWLSLIRAHPALCLSPHQRQLELGIAPMTGDGMRVPPRARSWHEAPPEEWLAAKAARAEAERRQREARLAADLRFLQRVGRRPGRGLAHSLLQ